MASWPLFMGVVREVVLLLVGLTVYMAACQLHSSSVAGGVEAGKGRTLSPNRNFLSQASPSQ